MEWKNIIEKISSYVEKAVSFFVSNKERFLALLKSMPWKTTWYRIQEKGSSITQRESQRVRVLYQRLVVRGAYTRRDLIILFGIAILCGIVLKAIATNTITIGFEDYKLSAGETVYDLNMIQKQRIAKGGVSVSSDVVSGGACSE